MVTKSLGTVTAAGIVSLLAAMPALAALDPYFQVFFDAAQPGTSTNADPPSTSPTGVKGSAKFTFTTNLLTLELFNETPSSIDSELVSMGFNVPAGFSAEGIPFGIQIVGRPGDDQGVMQMAYAWQQQTQHWRKPPTLG